MSKDIISYLIFTIALIASFILDMFVFSKKNKEVSIKSATYQYFFWVAIAILQKAADQFDYLQQGIAIVLIFIGAKMFLGLIDVELPNWISLLVIISCISGSIFYSMYHNRKKSKLTHDSH